MSWTKIVFVGRAAATAFATFRAAIVQVWMPVSEDDRIAAYSTDEYTSPITMYLSPRATTLVAERMPEVALEPCGRPPTDVWRTVGAGIASDPAWCDLSDEERAELRYENEAMWADAEEAFGTGESSFEVLGTFPL